MQDDTKRTEVPETPAAMPEEPVGDDWIGEVSDKVRAFRSEMADVAREADQGIIDGPLGRVLVFLKRYWAIVFLAILPFVPRMIGVWAENDPFPAVPEIITEAEVEEISDYALAYAAAHGRSINWASSFDRDGDGSTDARFYVYACDEPEREKWYIHTSLELPRLWDVITGKRSLAPQGEELAIQDGHVCIIVTVNGETAGDRSELRWTIGKALEYIREDLADGDIYEPPDVLSPLEAILQLAAPPEE